MQSGILTNEEEATHLVLREVQMAALQMRWAQGWQALPPGHTGSNALMLEVDACPLPTLEGNREYHLVCNQDLLCSRDGLVLGCVRDAP